MERASVSITTERELAARLDISRETLAIAAQQTGGVREFMRATIKAHGSMNIACRGLDGKPMRYGEVFALVYKEPLEKRKGRK